jgi:peroxiredoxin
MPNQLDIMDTFPSITLSIAGGGTLTVPDEIETPYAILLFYRGHWWPFCRRLLAGYEERRDAFSDLGVSIVAGTVDSEEDTAVVAADLGFPVAYGMTRETGDRIGAWWEERRNHIQPSEFLITNAGRVMSSTYSSSPVGRMDPEETLLLTNFLVSRKK